METYVKILAKSWAVSLAGIFCFAVLVVLFAISGCYGTDLSQFGTLDYTYVFWVVILLLILIVNKKTRRNLAKIRAMENLPDKLVAYRKNYVTSLFLGCCLVSFIALVLYMINHSFGNIIFIFISFIWALLLRPYALKVKIDLDLTEDDLSKFDRLKFTLNKKLY